MPINLALARPLGLGCSRCAQHPVRLGEIGAVPDPQGLRDADDFAVTGPRSERRRIEIGRNDVAPGCSGLAAVAIGARRGRDHLAEFLDDAGRAAARRMAKLFDLRGKGAGATFSEAAIDDTGDPSRHGKHEPAPFDGWVALPVLEIEKVVILDEQQAADHERRDRGEILIGPFRVARLVERVLIAVEQFYPGPRFLAVDRVAPLVDKPLQRRRPARLPGDHEMAGAQGVDKRRQLRIAEPLVIRPRFGEADILAGTGLNREFHVRSPARQQTGLQV